MPAAMSLFDLFQFFALFVGEMGRHLSMGFVQDFTDTLACVASHLLELRSRSVEDRRDLGHLFRGQIKFSLQPVAHSLTDVPAMVKLEEKMPHVRCAQESTRQSTGKKNQEETSDQSPFQRAIHCNNSV
jgi:hypothetical protein